LVQDFGEKDMKFGGRDEIRDLRQGFRSIL